MDNVRPCFLPIHGPDTPRNPGSYYRIPQLKLTPTPRLPLQVADNEMLVDEYEQYHNDRTDDVVVSRSGSEEPESEPLANDCKDLPTISSTWDERIPSRFDMAVE